MTQPIPKKIQANNPTFTLQPFNTLLIDGSNLLEICFAAHKKHPVMEKKLVVLCSF